MFTPRNNPHQGFLSFQCFHVSLTSRTRLMSTKITIKADWSSMSVSPLARQYVRCHDHNRFTRLHTAYQILPSTVTHYDLAASITTKQLPENLGCKHKLVVNAFNKLQDNQLLHKYRAHVLTPSIITHINVRPATRIWDTYIHIQTDIRFIMRLIMNRIPARNSGQLLHATILRIAPHTLHTPSDHSYAPCIWYRFIANLITNNAKTTQI